MPSETKYGSDEQGEAWMAIYERYGELPPPSNRIWEIQADLTRANTLISHFQELVGEIEREREAALASVAK